MSGDDLWSKDKGIVLAADVLTLEELRFLTSVGASVKAVVGIKLGFALALRFGLKTTVRAIRELSDLPVIYDHQKAATDIPEMGRLFAETCQEAGIQSIILFPLSGPDTLAGFVSAALKCHLNPIVGCFMTHQAYVGSEGGFISDDAPERMLNSAIEQSVRTFVLPGTKPAIVKQLADGPLNQIRPANIMMPGIGSQGGSIATSFDSAKGHCRIAIIGSAVYRSSDPKARLEHFAMEVEKC